MSDIARAPYKNTNMRGIACMALAYLIYAGHDASIKWLAADYPIWQILFIRSAISLPISLYVAPAGSFAKAWAAPRLRWGLLLRAGLVLGAWLCYFTASRSLGLAEMVTLYYASPLLVVVLAIPVLGERVPPARWFALALGFTGVFIACRPGNLGGQGTATALVLVAAGFWAVSILAIRRMAAFTPGAVQVAMTSIGFLIACGVVLPFVWVTPSWGALGLMLLVGGVGGVAQLLFVEGLRLAPASVCAPLEFSGLLWSFALGLLIWGDMPDLAVFVGAALILAGGATVIAGEWRGRRRLAAS